MNNEFQVELLGARNFESPLKHSFFVAEEAAVLFDATADACRKCANNPVLLEQAGPRKNIFFSPPAVRAAIVTCGGLCPGLNDVVRAVTMVLWYRYGVNDIIGLRYGYEGLVSAFNHPPLVLTPEIVEDIHQHGGTILGTSRGNQSPAKMTDYLVDKKINMLFAVGGDGTQKGALEIAREIRRRGLQIAVAGIPKTIDNDISYTSRTFGFETAVAMSQAPITCAHMEAKGVRNGIGLVKLMGRESGFVAAYAALASSDVNLVLVPEVPFRQEKLLAYLEERLARKSHAVVVVAEGAGQDLVCASEPDASGNRKPGDIGAFLKDLFSRHFRARGIEASVKYIDPSYTIRSAPAIADDSVFCFQLAENAVHAAMAGRTAMVISLWNGYFVHIPAAKAVAARKKIDPSGLLWQSVLDNTGQPSLTD